MFEFFHIAAEAFAEQGVAGLIEEVPGGKYTLGVAKLVIKKYKERGKEKKLRADLQEMIQASAPAAASAAQTAARQVPVLVPAGGPTAPDDAPILLERALLALPAAAHKSLGRKGDPKGRTLPDDFDQRQEAVLTGVLAVRPPRLRAGDELPGRDDYTLDTLLGAGGYGEVWLVTHADQPSLKRAVKFCFGETGEALKREAKLIGQVLAAGSHANIVPLIDQRLKGDHPWLMFEYVPGGTLTDWVHEAAGLTPDKRLAAVRAALTQIAAGAAFLHALRPAITHRDLKPSNVLYDPATKQFRVTDLGIGAVVAKSALRQGHTGLTTFGGEPITFAVGSHTELYASPQQKADGDPDPRDDVHALGVVGYQMQTGFLTYGAVPDFAHDLREAGADDALIDLLGRCMSRKPQRRPAHAGEVLALLKGKATLPPPPPPPPPVGPKAGDKIELVLPGGLKMAFAYCPPGTFKMGGSAYDDEKPVHDVTLSKGFYMGVYPVTQAEWKAVMGNEPSHFKGDRRPVEQVTWENAVAFCKELAGHAKRPVRLPTEAEWEYACRAGTNTEYWWGDIPKVDRMNYDGRKVWNGSVTGVNRQQTTDVGTFAENPWGLWDTHGNVCEWCHDMWDNTRGARVEYSIRGGSFYHAPDQCRSAFREGNIMFGDYGCCVGFRVCFSED